MRFIVPLVILLTTSWVAWGGRVTMDPNGPLSRTVKETLDPCPGYVPGDSPLVGIEETIRNTLDPCYGMVPIGEGNPDPDPPTVPSSLSVVPDGNTLGVQGVPSDDATFLGYRWCEGAGCTSFTNEVHVISKTVVYQIENLEWDTTYEVQARSEGQYGNSPWTASVEGAIGSDPNPDPGTSPSAPTDLTYAVSGTAAGVFWVSSDTSVIRYELSTCVGAGCSNYGAPTSIPVADGLFYYLTPLLESTTYGVKVVAFNSENTPSDTSLNGTFTTPELDNTPYQPGVAVFGLGLTETSITYIPVGDETWLTQEARICAGAGCNSSTTTLTGPDVITFEGLTTGETYGVLARQYGGGFDGGLSFPRVYVTLGTPGGGGDPTGPPAPVNVVVSEATTSISMTWQSGGGDTASYGYSMCTGVSCSSFGGITPVASTSVNITGLTADTTYGFRIYSYDSGSTVSSEYASATGTTNPLIADGGQCVDGVDCRCDVLVSAYGADVVFCEDFENPTLGDPGVWQTTGGGWNDQSYSNINNWCKGTTNGIPINSTPIVNNDVTNNNGCIYLLGYDDTSTQPGFGTAQFSDIPVVDQTFDGDVSLMQTTRPPDPGFTVTAEDGTAYALQQPGGFHGDAFLDRLVTNFGITSARYTAAGVDTNTIAWKGNQFTPANSAFTGTFNTTSCSPDATGMGTNLEPYSGTLWRFATAADAPGSYTNTVGETCAPTNSTSLKSAPSARSTPLMPRGEWVCQQIEYDNWGQADGRVRHWIDGELIIDVAIDMTSMLSEYQEGSGDGLLRFKWNNYYNGNSLGGSWNWDAGGQTPTTPGYPLATKNQGYPGTTWSGRLQDNMVIKEGSPVSCAEIGFD